METTIGLSESRRRSEALACLAEAQMALELAWTGSDAEDSFLGGLRKAVNECLQRIRSEMNEATTPEQLDTLISQVHRCAAKRAYWLDAAQIQTQADSCIRELSMWGVPQLYFDQHLKPLKDSVRAALAEAAVTDKPALRHAALRRAQAALEAVLNEYNYWDSYTDRYVYGVLVVRMAVLGLLGLASLVLALVLAFHSHRNIWAVGCAGLAGTCVSILLRQEPMAVYGDMIKSWIWAAGRVMTGIVATVVGIGLLASGVISVGFSEGISSTSAGVPAVTSAGTPAKLVPLHSIVHGCLEPGKGVGAPCGGGAMLLVLGFAMLFGFSERAFVKLLGQFEDRLGAGSDRGVPPPAPSTTVADGSPGKASDQAAGATRAVASTAAQHATETLPGFPNKGPTTAAALPPPAVPKASKPEGPKPEGSKPT